MAKSFFARHDIPYEERDVTRDERHMQALKAAAGRFITPTLEIDGQIVIGFGRNLEHIKSLLRKGGYLE